MDGARRVLDDDDGRACGIHGSANTAVGGLVPSMAVRACSVRSWREGNDRG
jgi:hypothetical protein